MLKSQSMTNTLTDLIERQAVATPDAVAINDREQLTTYAGFAATSRRLARGLSDAGIGHGDRVAFWMPNVAAYLMLHFACARLGAITVSVNTRFRSTEVGDIVRRAGCKALILWPSFKDIPFLDILADIDAAALAELETVVLYDEGEDPVDLPPALAGKTMLRFGDLDQQPELEEDRAAEDDGTVIFTTSGTTAAPKFVLHSQAGIVRHARDVADYFEWNRNAAIVLQALPLCGTFGHTQAMATLAAGCPMISLPVFSGADAARLMVRHGITHVNGSDEMFALILDSVAGDQPFPEFRYGGYASFNPAYADIPQRAAARGMPLVGLWGMSEMQALYARQDYTAVTDVRIRAGGQLASPDAAVRVRDPESGKLLPHGEAGEIEASGPSRMKEYFRDPAATAAALTEDGFIRTGDLGYTGADGGFVFLARMGDALRLGGFLVNPSEIEAQVQSHPSVDKVQVVGVETSGGTKAYAFVVPADDAAFDAGTVQAWCAENMAKFKVPAGLMALEAFPVTESANGVKIQKARLREMALAALGEKV
jgi:fatty-acyl-CoA synthase